MIKIIGMGNALVDVLVSLQDDSILHELLLPKGSMTLIDENKFHTIKEYFNKMDTHLSTGGSAGNAIRTLNSLGAQTGYIGKIGKDYYGDFYRNSLIEQGTQAHLFVSPSLSSGVASTFISKGGERTFGTYLGAALSLSAEELTIDLFQGYTYLFIEGYLVQNHDLIKRAMELAKQAGVKVCLDLASYNIVKEDHELFTFLVEKYVDIVFANEEEAKAFTGMGPQEAVKELTNYCEIAIVKIGGRGSLIATKQEVIHEPALPVPCVDTTGAGDFYAAAFLYGLSKHYTLRQCAKIGSIVAAEVVQIIGTNLSKEKWTEIKHKISNI
ncbi:MAG: adenosine kinase [Bacteroidaceae bacterium]|nr:adenosine kinase [Bacteroidaceae bacterium]